MVDALPYLVDYPYGCTEQTLNRFLPTVITQKVLLKMGLEPEGDPARSGPTSTPRRSATTGRAGRSSGSGYDRNPVFDEAEVRRMVKDGRGAADRDAALRRRLGLVLRLGRAFLAAHHGLVVHGLQIAHAQRRGAACPACWSAASPG